VVYGTDHRAEHHPGETSPPRPIFILFKILQDLLMGFYKIVCGYSYVSDKIIVNYNNVGDFTGFYGILWDLGFYGIFSVGDFM
jgi:hypothetical protein